MSVQQLQQQIEEINDSLFILEKNPIILIRDIYSDLVSELTQYVRLIPELNRIGLELDAERVVAQLRHLNDAIQENNRIELFDCLNFEIANSLADYQSILNIMNSEE